MTHAHKPTAKAFAALPLLLTLAACGSMPVQVDANNDGIRDTTERPRFFGRHAWDQKHAAEARQAQDEAPMPAPAAAQQLAPAAPAQLAQAPAAATPPADAKPKRGLTSLFSRPKTTVAPKPKPAPPAQPAPVQTAATPQPAPTATTQPKPRRALFPWAKAAESEIAQTKPTQAKPVKTKTPPIVGGYGPATDKAAVEAAAAFALSEAPGYKFSAVYSAKVQVVAGTNYSLCLWVRRPAIEPNPFSRRMVAATVFQGLDRHYELVSWREVEHCKAGA